MTHLSRDDLITLLEGFANNPEVAAGQRIAAAKLLLQEIRSEEDRNRTPQHIAPEAAQAAIADLLRPRQSGETLQ